MANHPPKGRPGGRQGHGYQRPGNLKATVRRLLTYITQYNNAWKLIQNLDKKCKAVCQGIKEI